MKMLAFQIWSREQRWAKKVLGTWLKLTEWQLLSRGGAQTTQGPYLLESWAESWAGGEEIPKPMQQGGLA